MGLRRAARSPARASPPQEIIEAIHAGEIKGLLSICFNPVVSLPDTDFTPEALDKLEFYAVIDFFLSETAQHADVVLPGSLHEEDEGTVDQRRGPRHQDQRGRRRRPGEARRDWQILLDIAAPARQGRSTSRTTSPSEIFEELRARLARAAPPTTRGVT